MRFGATVPIAVKDWPGWREDRFELSWWRRLSANLLYYNRFIQASHQTKD